MRILLTADTVGGVWTYAIELSRALGRHGVEVHLATMGAPITSEQRAEARCVANMETHSSAFKLEWMEDPWQDVKYAGDWLLRLEERLRPDVVHLNGFAHGYLPWRAPTVVVGHSCTLSWWRAVKGEDAPADWGRYRREVGMGLQSAGFALAPTKAMLDALEAHYGPLAAKGVIPNGRSPELFPPGDKEPFVFAAGRVWDEAKNIAALAAVAPRLAWPVYVAGDGESPDGGTAQHGNVRLLGRLAPQAVPYWYARASIYALPAKYEPFGFSALEAAMAGCALVLGDIPSLREVWGTSAIFVLPDDIHALEDAINSLIIDPQRRGFLADQARMRALEYTPERMAEKYILLYRRMMGESVDMRLELSPAASAHEIFSEEPDCAL